MTQNTNFDTEAALEAALTHKDPMMRAVGRFAALDTETPMMTWLEDEVKRGTSPNDIIGAQLMAFSALLGQTFGILDVPPETIKKMLKGPFLDGTLLATSAVSSGINSAMKTKADAANPNVLKTQPLEADND